MEPEPQKGPGSPKKVTKKHKRPFDVDDKYLLSISVMCVNSTVGSEGICHNFLVFGVMPKLHLPGSLSATVPQSQRIMMMETARDD